MKRQTNSTRFFYQNSKLVTVDQGGQLHSILRNADRPLADYYPAHGTGLLATDSKGSVLARRNQTPEPGLAYTAYGHASEVQAFGTLLGFNGERFEPVTGCYQLGNGYRTYTPVLMRFRSPDSWSPFGRGGLNAYAYCSADPINRSDPSGHMNNPTAPAVTPRFLDFKINRTVQRFHVDQFETTTTTTTTIEKVGQSRFTRSEAVTVTTIAKQTTELFEVLAEPIKGSPTVYVTRANLDRYLITSNELFAVKLTQAMGIQTTAVDPDYLNNLQNRVNGLTLSGNHLAASAADPNDSSTVRVSPANAAIRHG
ncbi:RHS repeat-associated core domain-containing protein [Pseudomonas sichuanensis]|uniref:RHS repeat-associated core domain-containing protein n=1 Tax=Pseudomonas sichuanensis TaxID=2213015 RepID=UPI0024491693|nr:RHS repeat-associated core domain-containing protein [Pseudomonas sichuanensis]MDH0730204.1 RHS repeat-associated core domain-containing protein [Pseudomonas sichuanensis]MDH1582410.1 RHS repeat-associated core domain-containing protein [Pseudomonas sichuanensis]MDH1591807.1 RHS repeat-associated core domain-containing protein [Pseudomonas sichuanensis]MDH1599698.1 RHS repeat-associated core domain-containing protein [Pseudomonas sichuanensis]